MAHRLYVQDYDDRLPSWYAWDGQRYVLWPEFLLPYGLSPGCLEDRAAPEPLPDGTRRLADYAMCAWGAGGNGTREAPYWRWPGAPAAYGRGAGPLSLAEVRRPTDILQFADGVTFRQNDVEARCAIRQRHGEGVLNGAFLDGHARVVTEAAMRQIGQDEQGYFYRISAADR
jgi:prepilin-type processing-associated H-X9-DG protein